MCARVDDRPLGSSIVHMFAYLRLPTRCAFVCACARGPYGNVFFSTFAFFPIDSRGMGVHKKLVLLFLLSSYECLCEEQITIDYGND